MRVAIYARVSTLDQDETLQLPTLRDYAGRAGWDIVREYTDKASAKDLDRPGWSALRSDAHRKEFDCILVTKLDRMIRSVRLLHSELIELSKFGISVYTLSEGLLDVESPAGKLSLTILGGVAEWERDIISLRTREGIAARKARGESFGRPAAELPIHKIALCRLSGYTWVHIAHELGLNVSTIRNHKAEIEAEADKIRMEWRSVCNGSVRDMGGQGDTRNTGADKRARSQISLPYPCYSSYGCSGCTCSLSNSGVDCPYPGRVCESCKYCEPEKTTEAQDDRSS